MDEHAQIAVVTGAAGGFGSVIVKDLLAVGYKVAATDISLVSLNNLKSSLGSPANLEVFEMDVTKIESIEAAIENITAQMGPAVTVLINNAGIYEKNHLLVGESAGSADIAKRTIDINLTGSFNCTTAFSRVMARLKYGRIINIASIAGIWGSPMVSAYAASKAGLIKATECWARELGPLGITVTAVAPGVCKTNMMKDEKAITEDNKYIKQVIPAGRFGSAEDVSEIVTFLATCRTNYITSATIELDGGLRVGRS